VLAKIAMVAGILATALAAVTDALPAQYRPIAAMIGAILAALGGLAHPVPAALGGGK